MNSLKTMASKIRKNRRDGDRRLAPEQIQAFAAELFGNDLHAKRVLSLANGVAGVLRASSLTIHAIGKGLAAAAGANSKHCIKQVDRLLSNRGIDVWDLFATWVPFVVGARKELVVALDWTDFEPDDQTMLGLHLITSHGRATPLVWRTVRKSELRGNQTRHEDEVIERLHAVLPPDVRITLLADRGFGDIMRYAHLEALGWDYVIRFRKNIRVEVRGESRPAHEWLSPTGRAKKLRKALLTEERAEVPAVVCVRAKKMKQAWYLATSLDALGTQKIVSLYGKRFRIEETFRDTKNGQYGLGLSNTHIRQPGRRDRLLLVMAMAYALLTLLGAAGEAAGLDRMLKANTSKRRTMSLFNQGCYWYSAIPNMPDERLRLLMESFEKIVTEQPFCREIFGVI